jgi:predicted component of type VI protein secretion system
MFKSTSRSDESMDEIGSILFDEYIMPQETKEMDMNLNTLKMSDDVKGDVEKILNTKLKIYNLGLLQLN